MKAKSLTLNEIKYIYDNYMPEAFPEDEIKPIAIIEELYNKGCYEALGVVENDRIIGYAFFIKNNNDYLFDYYSILSDYRNIGIGTEFLGIIKEHYRHADNIIGEVEDYTLSEGSDSELQERRYNFYMRNGMEDTGVKVKLFGVDYILIRVSNGSEMSKDMVRDLYLEHYRKALPEELFKSQVKVKN